jgi:hypothetical protein
MSLWCDSWVFTRSDGSEKLEMWSLNDKSCIRSAGRSLSASKTRSSTASGSVDKTDVEVARRPRCLRRLLRLSRSASVQDARASCVKCSGRHALLGLHCGLVSLLCPPCVGAQDGDRDTTTPVLAMSSTAVSLENTLSFSFTTVLTKSLC